jgi:hypothetical protein
MYKAATVLAAAAVFAEEDFILQQMQPEWYLALQEPHSQLNYAIITRSKQAVSSRCLLATVCCLAPTCCLGPGITITSL